MKDYLIAAMLNLMSLSIALLIVKMNCDLKKGWMRTAIAIMQACSCLCSIAIGISLAAFALLRLF